MDTQRNRLSWYFAEVEAADGSSGPEQGLTWHADDSAAQDRPDVRVTNEGAAYMVEPVTDGARQWVNQNVVVERWQWVGGSFAVDHRFIQRLVDGMREDGLT